MTAQNIYPLSLNGDTFNALKSDYDAMLRQTLTKMEDLKVEDATITVKVAVTLEKDQARDFQANGYDAMRDIVKPTFKHEISTVMQVKDKKSGSLGGTMELVWDQELGQYVMRPIDNGQTTLFDQPGGSTGSVVDAEYTVVDDTPALPAGASALPAPQEEPEDGGQESEELKERWDTFYWLLKFDGTPMKVLEAMGNYTVRTEANKVIQQIVDLVPGLHADHVSAGHTAQPAPVTRALVHHKHVSDLFCRCFCGPGPAYASAYDQHIR